MHCLKDVICHLSNSAHNPTIMMHGHMNLKFSKYLYGDQNSADAKAGTCDAHAGEEKCLQNLGEKALVTDFTV